MLLQLWICICKYLQCSHAILARHANVIAHMELHILQFTNVQWCEMLMCATRACDANMFDVIVLACWRHLTCLLHWNIKTIVCFTSPNLRFTFVTCMQYICNRKTQINGLLKTWKYTCLIQTQSNHIIHVSKNRPTRLQLCGQCTKHLAKTSRS